jgi:serine/threonine protein phosphatase PrpC
MCIFDGHGGVETAEKLKEIFEEVFFQLGNGC